eukprot:TRINITY_DN31796_c0_g1_i1.p1 TRINITY_DN31796_c0_g1~~TRINITY_DN31796_c0_g1_i1.p1  ORF type:complete len:383 (+),score=113.66 TRINITY_DN31796_c0_g1_i1:83-1231(+)
MLAIFQGPLLGVILLLPLSGSSSCYTAEDSCATEDQDFMLEQQDAETEEEIGELKMSLLQLGVSAPVGVSTQPVSTAQLVEEQEQIESDEEEKRQKDAAEKKAQALEDGDNDGIWDSLGGILHHAKDLQDSLAAVEKNVLDTIVAQTALALDEFDKGVNLFGASAKEEESKFAAKTHAAIAFQVKKVQGKVDRVMEHAKAMWSRVKGQIESVQRIIVGTLDHVAQKDVAIQLNGTMNSLIKSIELSSDSVLSVGKKAEEMTAETASCGVLQLNASLQSCANEAEAYTRKMDEAFKEINGKLSALAKKLPPGLLAPTQTALLGVEKRGRTSASNLLKVQTDVWALQYKFINQLQDKCLRVGKGCGQGGLFDKLKNFFKNIFRR